MKLSSIAKYTLNKIAFASLASLAMINYATAHEHQKQSTEVSAPKIKSIIVAGGCFWCTESDFEKYPGVIEAESGYINGTTENPTYREVASKSTGHYEVVKVTFDSNKTNAAELTEYFWSTIDPTDAKGQFCDKGSPYKTGLFYQNEEQKKVFEESLEYLKKNKPFSDPIVTEILEAQTFYPAEDYHQNYYKENKLQYIYYRLGCGRDARIKQLWGHIASKEIGKKENVK